jgi:hypothetical protein
MLRKKVELFEARQNRIRKKEPYQGPTGTQYNPAMSVTFTANSKKFVYIKEKGKNWYFIYRITE